MASAIAPQQSAACSSPPIHLHNHDEDEQKVQAPEVSPQPEPLVIWDDLCTHITTVLTELGDGPFDAEELAMGVVIMNPDILTPLSLFLLKDIKQHITDSVTRQPPFPLGKFLAVTRELYKLSIQNSRFYTSALVLEEKILVFHYITKEHHLRGLIQKVTYTLTKNPAETIPEIEAHKRQLSKLSAEISKILCLTCYADEETRLPMKTLLQSDDFHLARQMFQKLVFNLNLARPLIHQLKSLLHAIQSKQASLIKLLQPLYALETAGELTGAKKTLFEGYHQLFWTVGNKLIQDAFQNTFEMRNKYVQFALPEQFKAPLQETVRLNADWAKKYTPAVVANQTASIVDRSFITTFFANFGGADPEKLMNNFLYFLPDDWFEDLKTKMQESKTPEAVLEAVFIQDSGVKKPTFITLRKWCQKNAAE